MTDQTSENLERRQEAPYAVLQKTLKSQEASFGRRWTLFSDIDNTSMKTGVDNQELVEAIEQDKWGLTYITGRSIQEVVQFINEGKLAIPHAVGSRVGTRLYFIKESSINKKPQEITINDFIEDGDFIMRARARGFQKDQLHDNSERFIAELQQNEEFKEFNFRFQDHENAENWQTLGKKLDPFKLSFFFTTTDKTDPDKEKRFIEKLKQQFHGLEIAISSHADRSRKNETLWFFDVLPFAKHEVITYMSQKLHTNGVLAGDSGNDLGMLLTQFKGNPQDFVRLLVGGASKEALANSNYKVWDENTIPTEIVTALQNNQIAPVTPDVFKENSYLGNISPEHHSAAPPTYSLLNREVLPNLIPKFEKLGPQSLARVLRALTQLYATHQKT